MVLFQNAMIRDILFNTSKGLPLLESETIETNKKESKEIKESKELNNLSPKAKEAKEAREHRMNRNKSMENYVKYSWSWTL